MLVFQTDWEEHIRDYGCPRAGIDFRWLVEIVARINLYLPDDWRLTRSSNNFRIEIVAEPSVILVGRGYRLEGDRVVNIIDSVHKKEFVDIVDLRTHPGERKSRLDASLKRRHPETLVPNLYFFRPFPEDSESPLFARQYERVKKREDGSYAGDQYHRIHPLTRAGLDLSHSRWVRWTINGDVTLVDSAVSDYHGKDYWEVPQLKGDDRRASAGRYLSEYRTILEGAGIDSMEPPEKPPSPYEIEYKFLVPGTAQDARMVFAMVQDVVKDAGFQVGGSEARAKKQEDLYFDDDRFSLHAAQASFRLRRKKETLRVTLKKRLPPEKAFSEEGLYQRIEEEAAISADQEKDLREARPVNAFPFHLIPYVAPRAGALKPVLAVTNHRKTLDVADRNFRSAELCMDEIHYEIKGIRHGPYFEIEVESKGMPRDSVLRLAWELESKLGLIPSLQSKYERGISLLKISSASQEKRMVIIDTDCGVDDALALVLALKAPELDVKAVTTVSGNVHIDKVIPNVFKVFQTLELGEPPPVARGAEGPLKKTLPRAASKHGEDGLGDAIPDPDGIRIDYRRAWSLICETSREHPKQITLITLGPLTNLALAIRNDPEGVSCLKGVVAMGGVFFEVGNVRPGGEFNVRADPDAAFEVVRFCRDSCRKVPVDEDGNEITLPPEPTREDFSRIKSYRDRYPYDPSVVPLTFVGLDVTHRVLFRRSLLERAIDAHPGHELLSFVQKITKKFMDFYYENEWLPGCYLHDPLAVAYVINPAFLEIEKHIIQVETAGSFTSGMIFPDDRPTRNPAWRNPADEVIGIARKVEREAFEEFFMERLMKP